MAFGVYQLAEAAYRQVEAPALRQAGRVAVRNA
jgi:hypothetical protein